LALSAAEQARDDVTTLFEFGERDAYVSFVEKASIPHFQNNEEQNKEENYE